MLPENVQNKRDPIVPRRSDPEPLTASNSSENENRNPTFPIDQQDSPSDYMPQEVLSHYEQPFLLYRIAAQYKQLCSVRKATELSMGEDSLRTMFADNGPLAGLNLTTTGKISSYYKAHLPAIGDFASAAFDEFSQLTQEEKWLLFQSFVIIMWGMDSSYRTYRRVPPENFNSIFLLSETTYLDINRLDDFVTGAPASTLGKEDLVRLLNQCLGRPRQKMVYMMYEMQITEEEYAALLGLMLWNQNIEKQSESLENVSKQMRAKIFEQLHHLYVMNNMTNYAQRLGELMCLYSAVLQYVSMMKEYTELFNLLDAFKVDSFFHDFIAM